MVACRKRRRRTLSNRPRACHVLRAATRTPTDRPTVPDFTNKLVVLAGVGRRGQVGDVLGRAFAARGASLALLGRDEDELEARAAELRAAGATAAGYACDLADAAATESAARRVGDGRGGRVAALVNVAGGFAASGPVAASTPDVLQRMLAINLWTAYHTTRAFLPLLRPARGAIVYFASAAALPQATGSGLSAYAASKSAVLALMRAVAAEEAPHGVRANAVAPTAIRTPDNIASMGAGARYVEPDALAEAVLFLCSDAAAAVRGQVLLLE